MENGGMTQVSDLPQVCEGEFSEQYIAISYHRKYDVVVSLHFNEA
jgi:hypothetical protein